MNSWEYCSLRTQRSGTLPEWPLGPAQGRCFKSEGERTRCVCNDWGGLGHLSSARGNGIQDSEMHVGRCSVPGLLCLGLFQS